MNIIRPPTLRGYFKLALSLLTPLSLLAQDPNLALENLKYTREVAEANHLVAQVSMETETDKSVTYQYDRYSDVRRITTADGIAYAQVKGKDWVESKDWAKTGTPVKPDKTGELDTVGTVAEKSLADPVSRDKTQGEAVWKLIEHTKKDDTELFTYERSRERPNPDAVYPRYTFVKYKDNADGKLLLAHFAGGFRSGETWIPVEIKYDLLISLPADTTIEAVPAKPKKKGKQR